jgi:hypothetical protein
MIVTLIGMIKDEKDLAVCVKKFKKYLSLLQEVSFTMNPILPNKISFFPEFCYSKKAPKKQGSFNPWPSHTCWSFPYPQHQGVKGDIFMRVNT